MILPTDPLPEFVGSFRMDYENQMLVPEGIEDDDLNKDGSWKHPITFHQMELMVEAMDEWKRRNGIFTDDAEGK